MLLLYFMKRDRQTEKKVFKWVFSNYCSAYLFYLKMQLELLQHYFLLNETDSCYTKLFESLQNIKKKYNLKTKPTLFSVMMLANDY